MLGRLACDNPYAIAQIHHGLYPDCPLKSRHQIAQEYFNYLQTVSHTPLTILLKPLLNLAHGLPKAKTWKNHLITMQRTHTVPDNLESIFEILTLMNE